MRPAPTTTILLLAFQLAGCGGREGDPNVRSASEAAGHSCDGAFDPNAVTAVLDAQAQAWNAGDIESFLAGYERSEDLLFTSGSSVRRGFDETRRKFRARYGTATDTMGTLAFEILDVRGLGRCRDAAMVLGRWKVSDSEQAGSGVFSVLLERDAEGAWHIVHDHTSADPVASPPATAPPEAPSP